MKLTILGCNGPYPRVGGACSGYLLSEGKTRVLIDCGTGVIANLARHIAWEDLDAVILSHLHYDHMSDMLPMQYALQFHPRELPLPVYAPFSPEPVRAMLDAPCYELRPMEDVQIGAISFRFHPGRHPVQSFAMRAECGGRCFGYTGDTNELDGLEKFLAGLNLLLADAGLSNADWHIQAPHLNAEGCARLAQRARSDRLLLTHLNPKYTEEQLEAEARTVRPDAEFVRIGRQYDV